jgi:uncharacterized membrane protein
MKTKTKKIIGLIGGIGIALVLIGSALVSILSGRFNYRNYWGGVVFAPFAILIGVAFLLMMYREFKGKKIKMKTDDELFEGPLKDWRKW